VAQKMAVKKQTDAALVEALVMKDEWKPSDHPGNAPHHHAGSRGLYLLWVLTA
jgi:hypothetical protein